MFCLPDRVFKTQKEARAYMESETKRLCRELTGNFAFDVEVIFTNEMPPKRNGKMALAYANKALRAIRYYNKLTRLNLNNPDYYAETIPHECLHMVNASHSKRFKKDLLIILEETGFTPDAGRIILPTGEH